MADCSFVTLEHPRVSSHQFPHAEGSIRTRGYHIPTVGREDYAVSFALMSVENPLISAAERPHPHGSVETSAYNQPSVRTEVHSPGRALVAANGSQFATCRTVDTD